MSPQDGSVGQVNSNLANNQNEVSHHQSNESLQRLLLPLLPSQQGVSTPSTGISLGESPNVALGSNISPSSSTGTTPNISPHIDLSLNSGFSHQRTGVIRSSNNVAPRYVMQEQVMHGGLQTKRSFAIGESSNASEQTALAKQHTTDWSHVGANNNVNPSTPTIPQVQQVQQPFSETAGSEPIQGHHHHVNSQNSAAFAPQLRARVNRRGIQGALHFNQQPFSHHLRRVVLQNPSTSGPSQSLLERGFFTSASSYGTQNYLSQVIQPHVNYEVFLVQQVLIQQVTIHALPIQQVLLQQVNIPLLPFRVNYEAFPLQQVLVLQVIIPTIRSHVYYYPNQVIVHAPLAQQVPRVNYEAFLLQQVIIPITQSYVYNHLHQVIVHALPAQQVPVVEPRTMPPSESEFGARPVPHAGLSVEVIMQLLKHENFMSVDGKNQDEKEKCPICQEDFQHGEEIGKLDSCMHMYHVECIKQWLMNKNECPVCKRIGLNVNNV